MSVFIVAEAGVNHLGDRAKMLALCDAAKTAGADAVKFQAYDTDKLLARRGKGDRDLLAKCELSDADLDAIAAHCKNIGLKWFASVFDPSQIERVLSRGACALKIGHAEAGWSELVRACEAQTSLRTWISNAYSSHPNSVYCVAEYPAKSPPRLGEVGEYKIGQKDEYEPLNGFVGFSSHYTDYRIPAAAALRGAEYIEAHLMLGDGELVGETFKFSEPEAAWSLSPFEFGKMVKLIRTYEGWL